MNEIRDFEKPLLTDEAKFIETYCSDASGEFITYDHWQRDYVCDRSRLKIVKKSRRTGFTFADTGQGLYRSQHYIGKSAPYVYEKHFISRNLNDTREKITVARYLYDCLPAQRKLSIVSETKTELIFEDYRGRLTRLKAHTANDPRGIGGDISFDEAAFIKNFRKLYAAGQLVTARGGDTVIGSSPGSASGLFWEIYENKGGSKVDYSKFSRRNIPWWLSRTLCKDVLRASIEAPGLATHERVYQFGTEQIIGIFETMLLEDFQQECECFYADESSTFFPYELLRECEESNYGEDAKDGEVKLPCRIQEGEPSEEFWKWVRSNRQGIFECGYDVGRKRDISALIVTDKANSHRQVRAIVKLKSLAFDIQEKIINDCIRIIQPIAFRFDNTGMGMNLGERLEQRHGSMFERVNFTAPSKALMATNLKYEFEKRTITIPSWGELTNNIHSIKKEVNERTANISFEADANDHHGDLAWALALACYSKNGNNEKLEYSTKGKRVMSEGVPI